MPLNVQIPNLDNRRFDDLVAEAKTLIPRYTPEWTDFNESDPGITLLQLFAWMTDILIYRLNQVPELNYLKFLQLLGIELRSAQPARADLTFKLSRPELDFVIIPTGTQVAASASGSAGPVIFETSTDLIALGAQLTAVQTFDSFSYTVETQKNSQTGQWFYPFGPKAREGSALLLGFESPLDSFTQQQINLTVYVYNDSLKAATQHCDPGMSILPVPATLVWEYWNGERWVALVMGRDETRAFTQNGHIYFRGPGSSIKKDKIGLVADKPRFWIRVRLGASSYERSPRLAMILTNTVGALQAVTVRNESLGRSNGQSGQTFTLAQHPVVVRDTPLTVTRADGLKVQILSLRLEVDEGNGNFQVWQEVSDFYGSKRDDPHYTLNRNSGLITFGDGQYGRIPPASATPSSIIAREYSYGGGKQGNVGTQTIAQLQSSVASVDSVTNLQPAFGGSDEETLDVAKLRASAALKSRERAVTADDFEYLAVETPSANIRRAKALPLTHPNFPGQPIPGVVTVIVIPASDTANPTPNQQTLAQVCSYLNTHRLLTSEVYVIPPTYRKVRVQVDVTALPQAYLSEVQQGIQDSLTKYFHALTGGDDGQGWVFGQDIFYSSVYRVILNIPGIAQIQPPVIFLDDEAQPIYNNVPIGAGNLLYSDQHTIQVAYS